MNSGIYALKFNNVYYVGKSSNLLRREKDHRASLINNTANYKVMEAYKIFGEPSFIVLEYLDIEYLNNAEIEWIQELDTIENGLNISSGGDGGGFGYTHNRAIHSKELLLEVADLLISDKIFTYSEISKLTEVSISTINNITLGIQHTWLSNEVPEFYTKLSSLKEGRSIKSKQELSRNSVDRHKIFKQVIDPTGNVHSIIKCNEFALEHGLCTAGLSRLLNGKIKSHRNWKLA